MGSLQFHVVVRGQRIGIRLKDTDSAAVRNFQGLIYYPLDMNYRVTATWVPSDGKKTIDVPNVLGDVTPLPVAGTVVFKIKGQEVRLTDLGGDPVEGAVFCFQRPDREERYISWRALSRDWSGCKWECGTRLQPGLQSSLCGNSVCDVSVSAEREPAWRCDRRRRKVRQVDAWAPLKPRPTNQFSYPALQSWRTG